MKKIIVTPEVMKVLTQAVPPFHNRWRQYQDSPARRQWLTDWAAADPERQRVVAELLSRKVP